MPAGYTPAPHYPQSNPGACLPACARMVLATFNEQRSETELSAILESYDFGTPAYHISYLSKIGYQVEYRPFALNELAAYLAQGLFPIVFVHADLLPWTDFSGFHALVLIKITTQDVLLLDPALPNGPTQLAIDGFLAAWEEFDRRAAVVSRK